MTAAEQLSAEQAVDRAFWMVKLPSLVLMFGPWLSFLLFVDRQHAVGSAGFKIFLPTFIGGFVLGWLAWSVQVPRWRLWAYSRVNDIEKLKALAVAKQIIWPEGHFFERTEIASADVKRKLRELESAGNAR